MEINGKAKLLRIHISNTDKFRDNLLYEMLVFAAKRYGIAGATVTRGIMGFGSSSKIYSENFWELSEKLPVVVELIDETEKIDQFTERILPWLQKLKTGCLITSDVVTLVHHQKGEKRGFFQW
ncbi:MAG: DUF190 domain-containing protein [Bacteroidales bacterium]